MKRKIFIPIAFLFLLVGCDYNDKYFDGLDDLTQPTDVKKVEYTLLDEDYGAIAKYTANVDSAKKYGVSDELSNLGTTKRFSETLKAPMYAPAFIADKWYTSDDGSSVKLTYNQYIGLPEYVLELNKATMYKVSAEDYVSVWGEGSTTNFFTPATPANTHVPAILKSALPEAEAGDIVAVDYNESENEPTGAVVAINEDFNHFTETVYVAEVEGWHNIITVGTYAWTGRVGDGNGYLQASAFNHSGGESEVYMITPKFTVSKGQILSFEACYTNYREEGGRLAVLISSNLNDYTSDAIASATWEDVSTNFIIEIPTGTYGDLKPVGELDLNEYLDKEIHIAFKYYGNSSTNATSTVRIDNVVVESEPSGGGEDKYIATTGLFSFNGTVWTPYSGNGYMVTKSDYTSMGINYDNFTSSIKADDYLPVFLKLKYPYAKEGDVKAPTYKYYDSDSKQTTIYSDEYIYSGNAWVKNEGIEVVTDQFVLNESKWNFDPSIVINLKPVRNQPAIALYYQAIVDYVADTYGTGYYQTGYKNAEYYFGASSYQNNFDFRISAWRNSHANGASSYGELSDEDLEKLMYDRLKEAFIPALKANHSDMAPIEGIDVVCTIMFGVYTGSVISEVTHEIQFKVTAPGEFEYMEDSLKEL